MAVCGSSCSITIGSELTNAHRFSINWAVNETDVRVFGSGSFGSWIGCQDNGTLEIALYEPIAAAAADPGAAITFSGVLGGGHTVSGTAVGMSLNVAVDAKGLVEYVYTSRLDGDLTLA
jgi:hypothetical protein